MPHSPWRAHVSFHAQIASVRGCRRRGKTVIVAQPGIVTLGNRCGCQCRRETKIVSLSS